MIQTQQQSICNRIRDRRISIFGHVGRLQVSVPAHEALRLVVNTRIPVTDLMTEWSGNVHEVVPDKPGSASWRSMSSLLQMLLGTWLVIATSAGRNDPSSVKRSRYSERVNLGWEWQGHDDFQPYAFRGIYEMLTVLHDHYHTCK